MKHICYPNLKAVSGKEIINIKELVRSGEISIYDALGMIGKIVVTCSEETNMSTNWINKQGAILANNESERISFEDKRLNNESYRIKTFEQMQDVVNEYTAKVTDLSNEVAERMNLIEKSNFSITIETPYVIISNDDDVDIDVPVDTNIVIRDRDGKEIPIIKKGEEAEGVVVKYTCIGCYFGVGAGSNSRSGVLEDNHFHKDAVYVVGNTSRIDFEAVRYSNGVKAGIQRQSLYIIKTESENPLLTKYGEAIITKDGHRVNVLTANYK